MLVLKRKKNEAIKIGDNIEVFVVRVHDDFVALGITAPEGIKILRTELLDDPRQTQFTAVEDTPGV